MAMRVLLIEPFYGGSHRLFADRVAAFSAHEVSLLTLPASFWKWRMRGAHLRLAEKLEGLPGPFDCLLAADMLSLAEFVGTVPSLAAAARVVYFHENQLGYPVPKGEAPDVHFGFTNLSTALAADRLVFNSRFHLEEFLGGIAAFLGAMPDHRPRRIEERLRPRARVVYPGIDLEEIGPGAAGGRPARRPLRILWNHRWEFDKQPEVFFGILRRLAAEGLDFRVQVLGENFQARPKAFLEAREFLGHRLERFGFLRDRGEYIAALRESDVVVSTAIQEFYGLSVLEAAGCGCLPLVPERLVYPELYPAEARYGSDEELESRLRGCIREGIPDSPWMDGLVTEIHTTHDVRRSVVLLDEVLADAVARNKNTGTDLFSGK